MPERDIILQSDDAELSAMCTLDFWRATGNGGQKRNKTSSAVRVRLTGTDFSAEDCTERSQHRNRANALAKLRMSVALAVRKPFAGLVRQKCAVIHRDYPLYMAQIFDALAESGWEMVPAAEKTGLSRTALWKILSKDTVVWQEFCRKRQENGLVRLEPAK